MGAGFLFLLFISVMLGGYIGFRLLRPVRYGAFGISMPIGFAIHGIDVSHHQEKIDWAAVKGMRSEGRGIGFVFIKAKIGRAHV